LFVSLYDTQDHLLFSTIEDEFPASIRQRSAVEKKPHSLFWRQNIANNSNPFIGVRALLPIGTPGRAPLLAIAALDISHHEQFLSSFRKTLWTLVGLAACIVSFLGWATVKYGLTPLKTIREGAAAVTANRLDYRLSLASIPVELAELAITLNNMLERLQESFQRLKDFSSDLAHELRTPIANLMTQNQVALSRARSSQEYQEVLASNLEEYERLARMISDMLFLAQADNGLLVLSREKIELSKEVKELFDFYDALAEEKGIQLILTGTALMEGDKSMLRRALSNLLSNAIRHTPEQGAIQVMLAEVDGKTQITVENQGEEIAVHHLPHIFERFYRADPSRHQNDTGAGLGLSIILSIIRAHGGDIHVQSAQGKTSFQIQLPNRPISQVLSTDTLPPNF
jgi:two-component system heavy metal sensor histidine kinase CusS